MDYQTMTTRFFLELVNEKFGEDSETAKSIAKELTNKESIAFAHLPESQIATITFHENDPDSDTFYLSGTLSVPFNVYRKK